MRSFKDHLRENIPPEVVGAAVAAHISRIPIAHIHGGELTNGVIDDAFRHSITKMSQLHFVSNKIYRKRVIQLGENPETVYTVGGMGVESIKNTKLLSQKKIEKKLKIKFLKKNLLINFHPETLRKGEAKYQVKELINDFYKTRKDRGSVPSAYAYECKRCSIKRVSKGRRKKEKVDNYPDW